LQRRDQCPSEDWNQADILKTYNFCVGSSEYCSHASPKFLFGQSETCRLEDVKAGITKLLPNDRNVVLITHDGQMDINFTQELEISFQPIYVLDTQKIAQHPLQLARRIGLRGLLNMLQIKFQHMHVAGNDANFTLRALLLLGIWDSKSEGIEVSVKQEGLVVALRAVAQLKRPRSAVEHAVRAGSGSTK
jgi:DNA polymerase III alpha subunit (gram-positive type)